MQRYPGSKKPIKTFDRPSVPSKPEVDPFALPDGKKMWVEGREIEFFTIGDLARCLNRQPVTMRKWESDGVIPKATYIKPSKVKDSRGLRRLYSREQIEGLVQIAREEGVWEPNENGKWKLIEDTDFRQRAYDLFVTLEGA